MPFEIRQAGTPRVVTSRASLEQALTDADVAHRLGSVDVAERLYRQVLRSTCEAGHRAEAYLGLGLIARFNGHAWLALSRYGAAVDSGDLRVAARAAEARAECFLLLGNPQQALRMLAVTAPQTDSVAMRRCAILAARAFIALGAFDLADATLDARQIVDLRDESTLTRATLMACRANVSQSQCDWEVAGRDAEVAVDELRESEDTYGHSRALWLLALSMIGVGRTTEAVSIIEQARVCMERSSGSAEVALLVDQAHALAEGGQESAGRELASQALSSRTLNPSSAARAHVLLGQIAEQRGLTEEAERCYRQAVAALRACHTREMVQMVRQLAHFYRRNDHVYTAISLLDHALVVHRIARRDAERLFVGLLYAFES
jgi:tetratricopeptide (TPR) repeat protein